MITDLKPGLPRARMVGGFGSLPVLLSPPHLSERPLYVPAPRSQLALSEARGVVGRGSHFLPRAIPKGVTQQGTHLVINGEGGETVTVHCSTWIAASSPPGSWL
jgi:hypothetical protein